MMSREQNEQLSCVGPGTLMGKLLRRYWAPFLLSSEIPEPDCPPVRAKLMGESYRKAPTMDYWEGVQV